MSKPPKTTQQKTEDFFKTIESGDISLFELFDEAIAMFGFTKVGKTTSCHMLADSALKAENVNGDLIYKPSTQKYNTATIGLTTESQTEIPNIFVTEFKDENNKSKPITLLDQPGYGDTYGFHRIFSNGYFHYRTFSKTPKLKFILAFKKVDLEGTAEKFKNTIKYFIETFTNYDAIQHKILAATSFLITQADPQSTIEDLTGMVVKLRNQALASETEQTRKHLTDMINDVIDKKKLFMIKRPHQIGNKAPESEILKQIYNKTQFWVREIKENNIVDMSQINFSVAAEILNGLFSFRANQLFKKDFDHFMDYMQNRINRILLNDEFSLKNIVEILKRDAQSSVEAHSFLEGMSKFVETYYNFNPQYRQKREKTEANLFHLKELNESNEYSKAGNANNQTFQTQKQEREKEMRQVYFIKKFKVLEFIKERADKILYDSRVQRSVQWLEYISSFFIEMFKKFNLLRVQKHDSERIIYKYCYIVQRLIQESKILTLILFSNQDARKRFDDYKENMVDIFRPLNDKLFSQFGDLKVQEQKISFIKNLDLQKLQVINRDIINFFEGIKHIDNSIQLKIAKLIIIEAENINQKKKIVKDEEKRFIAVKLLEYRNNYYDYLMNIKDQGTKDQKESSIESIFALSNCLGNILSSFEYYEDAREVFKSINNADLVFNIFETELKASELNPQKCRSLLLEYGKYAGECQRTELAMKCFQQAYGRSKTYAELSQVKAAIVELKKVKVPDQNAVTYLKKIFNEQFCSAFSENLKTKIKMFEEQDNMVDLY